MKEKKETTNDAFAAAAIIRPISFALRINGATTCGWRLAERAASGEAHGRSSHESRGPPPDGIQFVGRGPCDPAGARGPQMEPPAVGRAAAVGFAPRR